LVFWRVARWTRAVVNSWFGGGKDGYRRGGAVGGGGGSRARGLDVVYLSCV
jgi:hypothetical protein